MVTSMTSRRTWLALAFILAGLPAVAFAETPGAPSNEPPRIALSTDAVGQRLFAISTGIVAGGGAASRADRRHRSAAVTRLLCDGARRRFSACPDASGLARNLNRLQRKALLSD